MGAVLTAAILVTGCGSVQAPPERTQPSSASTSQSISRSPAPSSTSARAAVHKAVAIALKQQGVRYRYGGSSPSSGFDCSGLIHYSFGQAGIAVPRTTQLLLQQSRRIKKTDLMQGDILFFRFPGKRKASHAAIYMGDGNFVHAPSSGKKVSIARLDKSYWAKAYVGAGRF